jgi:ABC-type hemin transport system substrate-binding protein
VYEVAPTHAIARPVCGVNAAAAEARTLSIRAVSASASLADEVDAEDEVVAEEATSPSPSLHATRVASSAHSAARMMILSCIT